MRKGLNLETGINPLPLMGISNLLLDERFNLPVYKGLKPMPFFHTCDAVYLQKILDSEALIPRLCTVYNENLLYLFYGKPAYKSSEQLNSTQDYNKPICFIINYESVNNIKRIMPFDSGAFKKYNEVLHNSMVKEEFELTPDKKAIQKSVEFFYESNEAYFEMHPRAGLADKFGGLQFQISGYYGLINSPSKTKTDDRKACFEVQLDKQIALTTENIEAIVLPKSLHMDPLVNEILIRRLNIPLIPYNTYCGKASNYYVNMLEIVRNFMAKKGIIDEL